jgi:hypothetical protein
MTTPSLTTDPVPAAGIPLLDARSTTFSLTVGTAIEGRVRKLIIPGVDGRPVKGTGSLAITKGVLEHVTVDGLAGLQALLAGIRDNQALVHGVVNGSRPGDAHPFVPTRTLKRAAPGTFAPDTIARSLEYLAHPADVFLLLWDHDDNAADPTKITTAEELFALLAPLFPGIETAGRVVTCSTSSAMRDKQSHAWVTPPYGFHAYQLVRGDLNRFRRLLKARLWNAGYGYCCLASPNKRTGVASVLERGIVDWTVFSPERLDYVAGAEIPKSASFYQDRGAPVLVPGHVLDLESFSDLTPEEHQEYQQRLREAKAALAPARFQTVKATVEREDPTLTPDQVATIARQRLERIDSNFLEPDFLLEFDHRTKAVRVRDLSKDYDGLRLADPAEPDYREGTDAIFHWNSGAWLINSFAHGVLRTYRALPTPPEPEIPPEPLGPPVHLHHLPAHLATHPDASVRTYWQRLYHRANRIKQQRVREGARVWQ